MFSYGGKGIILARVFVLAYYSVIEELMSV